MLVRTQWIEGAGRLTLSLFRDQPPTIYAPFVERVPMIKGRWDPNASTATAYAWFCLVPDMRQDRRSLSGSRPAVAPTSRIPATAKGSLPGVWSALQRRC